MAGTDVLRYLTSTRHGDTQAVIDGDSEAAGSLKNPADSPSVQHIIMALLAVSKLQYSDVKPAPSESRPQRWRLGASSRRDGDY